MRSLPEVYPFKILILINLIVKINISSLQPQPPLKISTISLHFLHTQFKITTLVRL